MKLSVMLLTYNHERYIAQAIQSVLDQCTTFDYEIVVGEDCSTDRTREIVMDFHCRYPDRIVPILRSRNVGGAQNFAETRATCRGQFLAVLEGDDYWTRQDKLQRQVDFLDTHPEYAICCGRVQVLNEIGSGLAGIYPPNMAGTHTIEDLLRTNFIWPCTVVYRGIAVGSLPDWFGNLVPLDWVRSVMIARKGNIELMDEVVAVYRVHSGGMWSSRSQLSRLKQTIRMLMMLDEELEFRHTNTIRSTVTECYAEWGRNAQRDGSRAEAVTCLVSWLRDGGGKNIDVRPTLKGLAWYTLLGSWHPVFAKAKRAILG